VLKAGPKYMENRKPFKLNNVIRVYNLLQILGCLGFVVYIHTLGFTFKFLWKCSSVNNPTKDIPDNMITYFHVYWWFLLLRVSEFFETVVFVLRKKQSQVSLLHVYHHIAVVALLWMFLKYVGEMGEAVIGIFNSSVHVLMYSYYFLSSFESFKKATSKVKPLITAVQIGQLIVLFLHCFVILYRCQVSKIYYLQAANLAILVFMFFKFFIKSYSQKNNKKLT
jgi:GNS1/SUR4 family